MSASTQHREHAATLLAFVNETDEEKIPSYVQVEEAVHGLVEQLEAPCRCDRCRDCVAANGYERLQEQLEAAEEQARKFGRETGGYLHDLLAAQTRERELQEQYESLSENNRHTHANLDVCIGQRTRLEEQLESSQEMVRDLRAKLTHLLVDPNPLTSEELAKLRELVGLHD